MKRSELIGIGLTVLGLLVITSSLLFSAISQQPTNSEASDSDMNLTGETVNLPDPDISGQLPLEQAILQRRSVRSYSGKALSLSDISQILWSAQGVTDQAHGFRSVPSAGALYPLEIYLAAGAVMGLDPGIYLYNPQENQLHQIKAGDRRDELYAAALSQQPVMDAPASIVIAAVFERTEARYGSRAEKYVHLEAGHAGQNICLQVVSLGMAAVPIGAFHDQEIKSVIGMSAEETPLYLFPIGYPAD